MSVTKKEVDTTDPVNFKSFYLLSHGTKFQSLQDEFLALNGYGRITFDFNFRASMIRAIDFRFHNWKKFLL